MTSKASGTRGKGQAMFIWLKTQYKSDPLPADTLEYLKELAEIRSRMFDGKARTEASVERLNARHEEVVGILGGFHSIEVRFPRQRVSF